MGLLVILVSACLVGLNTKYNGGNNYNSKIFNLVKEGKAIFVCPEQLGGLSTPRVSSEIKVIDGKRYVFDKFGNDVSKEFFCGANEVLELVKKLDIKTAILQSRSPSCGINKIYDGSFSGNIIDGNGILAQMLLDIGIEVIDVKDIDNYEF